MEQALPASPGASEPESGLDNAWNRLARDARTHYRLLLFGAVYRIILHLRRQGGQAGLERYFVRYPFLLDYFNQMRPFLPVGQDWESSLRHWEQAVAAWLAVRATDSAGHPAGALSHARSGCSPVQRLSEALKLNSDQLALLMLVGLVEEDARFGGLFAELQAPLTLRRPCLELLRQLLGVEFKGVGIQVIMRPLSDAGLIEPLHRDAPRSEWVLRVPPALWEALQGEDVRHPTPWCELQPLPTLDELSSLILPATLRKRLEAVPALLERGLASTLVLRGSPGGERLRIARALARACGRAALVMRSGMKPSEPGWAQVGLLAVLHEAIPILTWDLLPGETLELAALPGYTGPLFIALGGEGGLTGSGLERALTLSIPGPGLEERMAAWHQALGERQSGEITLIAQRFLLPLGHLRRVALQAQAIASLEGRSAVNLEDVREASAALNRQQLDALAHRLEPEGGWERLVVSGGVMEKLHELEYRCRHREQAQLGVGFGAQGPRGVRALLTGPSGTGKTLAAQLLAAQLQMSLYRVDLAAVINKYIGETEKNLHQVLSRAEELDVILLIDEGDALLGNRTQVRSANDRYANLETNYLLQRIEHYQGIVLVTTNAADHIDTAFQRRMDVVVSFLHPQPEQRRRIWLLHLPDSHRVSNEGLEEVSTRCAMTGGQIRNAVLHAALLAAERRRSIGDDELHAAIVGEYQKSGAVCPLTRGERVNGERGGMQAYLSMLKGEGGVEAPLSSRAGRGLKEHS